MAYLLSRAVIAPELAGQPADMDDDFIQVLHIPLQAAISLSELQLLSMESTPSSALCAPTSQVAALPRCPLS